VIKEQLQKLKLEISNDSLAQLDLLVDELLRWTKRRNLTAITDRDEVLEKHLVDSLTMLPFARTAGRLLDMGSGAGFPALPLKIVCPALEVVSVDAVGKKIDFQKHVARKLGLSSFTGLHARIQNLQEEENYRAGFDLVTARALTSLEDLVAMAEPFLEPGGRLVAMKGPEGEQEFSAYRNRLSESGWSIALHRLVLPRSGAQRCLIELAH
jgi:16S rRNA (guanine527-N7)-methyltransferase